MSQDLLQGRSSSVCTIRPLWTWSFSEQVAGYGKHCTNCLVPFSLMLQEFNIDSFVDMIVMFFFWSVLIVAGSPFFLVATGDGEASRWYRKVAQWAEVSTISCLVFWGYFFYTESDLLSRITADILNATLLGQVRDWQSHSWTASWFKSWERVRSNLFLIALIFRFLL